MKIAIVFPGYGSQHLGMNKKLYDDERLMQEYVEDASACLNSNFVKLLFASSENELAKMHNAYLSIFIVSYSIYKLLEAEGVVPTLMTGQDVGMFSALVSAGAMTFPDALYSLSKFLNIYQDYLESNDFAMLHVIGADSQTIEKLCKKASDDEFFINIAFYVDETTMIVAGHAAAVEKFKKLIATDDRISYQDQDCVYELHSSLMQPVIDELQRNLVKVDFHDLKVPVLRTRDGALVHKKDDVIQTILAGMAHPARPEILVPSMADMDVIIQVGPGDILARMMREQYPKKWVFSVNERSDINEIKKLLQMNVPTEKE